MHLMTCLKDAKMRTKCSYGCSIEPVPESGSAGLLSPMLSSKWQQRGWVIKWIGNVLYNVAVMLG